MRKTRKMSKYYMAIPNGQVILDLLSFFIMTPNPPTIIHSKCSWSPKTLDGASVHT